MGFIWEDVNANGSKPYLCTFDLNTLIDDAVEAFDHGTSFNTYELIDRAFDIRQERISNGIKFLNLIKRETLESQLLQKVSKPPSRAWVNFIFEKISLKLRDRRNIKLQRLTECNMKVLEVYFELLRSFFQRTSPFLIFGADETMLETHLETKVIVPNDITGAIAAEVENFQHISIMCCQSIYDKVIPPFMIQPTLNKLPDDLKIFTDFGQIDIACAPSGYISNGTGIFWTICFKYHLNVRSYYLIFETVEQS